MDELIFVVEEAPEGGYTARALGAAIFTEADDMDDLREMVRDAVRCHFDQGQGPRLTAPFVWERSLRFSMKWQHTFQSAETNYQDG